MCYLNHHALFSKMTLTVVFEYIEHFFSDEFFPWMILIFFTLEFPGTLFIWGGGGGWGEGVLKYNRYLVCCF